MKLVWKSSSFVADWRPSSRRRSARHDTKAYNRQKQMTKLSYCYRTVIVLSTYGHRTTNVLSPYGIRTAYVRRKYDDRTAKVRRTLGVGCSVDVSRDKISDK